MTLIMVHFFCNLMPLHLLSDVNEKSSQWTRCFVQVKEEGRLIDAGNRGKFDGCLSRFFFQRTFFKRRCFVEKAFWQWSLMCIDCFFSSNYRSEWITSVNGVTSTGDRVSKRNPIKISRRWFLWPFHYDDDHKQWFSSGWRKAARIKVGAKKPISLIWNFHKGRWNKVVSLVA